MPPAVLLCQISSIHHTAKVTTIQVWCKDWDSQAELKSLFLSWFFPRWKILEDTLFFSNDRSWIAVIKSSSAHPIRVSSWPPNLLGIDSIAEAGSGTTHSATSPIVVQAFRNPKVYGRKFKTYKGLGVRRAYTRIGLGKLPNNKVATARRFWWYDSQSSYHCIFSCRWLLRINFNHFFILVPLTVRNLNLCNELSWGRRWLLRHRCFCHGGHRTVRFLRHKHNQVQSFREWRLCNKPSLQVEACGTYIEMKRYQAPPRHECSWRSTGASLFWSASSGKSRRTLAAKSSVGTFE